jgi:hypothetical protein
MAVALPVWALETDAADMNEEGRAPPVELCLELDSLPVNGRRL